MSLLLFPLTLGSNVGFPIKSTPRYNTIIQTPASGRGQIRIPTQEFPLWDFQLDVSFISGDAQDVNSQYQQLVNFYMAVQGSAEDWLFLHPYDNIVGTYTVTGTRTSGIFSAYVRETVTQTSTGASAQVISLTTTTLIIGPYTGVPDNVHTWVGQSSGAIFTPSSLPVLTTSQQIAIGDGATKIFGMFRSLIVGGAQDLIQNFVGLFPNIYVNNALKTVTTDYTINQYGDITFTSAPANLATISWTGQFYYRCYFLEDAWGNMQLDYYKLWSMNGLKFRSVLL